MNSQRSRNMLALATVLVCLVPVASQAIVPYSQDFEQLSQTDIAALENDGWQVFGNVFTPTGDYLYGYGPFPAPNDGAAFCQIDLGQGGVEQGFQQLVVFNDYNSGEHANGNLVEANVYQEQTIDAADVGKTWKFAFQAKRGNLVAPSTAFAFIKTLDQENGFALTNFVPIEMTTIPETWGGYSVSLNIDASLEGQLFQIGFYSVATGYVSSAIFYDNIIFEEEQVTIDVPEGRIAGVDLRQNYPNPFNPSTRIDFSLERAGAVELTVYDLAGRKVANLHSGDLAAGDHHVTWNGRTDTGAAAPTGQYNYVLRTVAGQISRSMVLLK